MILSLADRAQLKQKAEAATPGPWTLRTEGGDTYIYAGTQSLMCDMQYYPWTPGEEDMAFIANANPAVVLALLRDGEVLEKLKMFLHSGGGAGRLHWEGHAEEVLAFIEHLEAAASPQEPAT